MASLVATNRVLSIDRSSGRGKEMERRIGIGERQSIDRVNRRLLQLNLYLPLDQHWPSRLIDSGLTHVVPLLLASSSLVLSRPCIIASWPTFNRNSNELITEPGSSGPTVTADWIYYQTLVAVDHQNLHLHNA